MFDTDGDGTISKTEFKAKLSKYTQKAQTSVEEVFGDQLGKDGKPTGILTAEEMKIATDLVNENRRKKMVYEDFGFNETDEDELARRDAETIELIKTGKLIDTPIKGDLTISIFKANNLPEVDG